MCEKIESYAKKYAKEYAEEYAKEYAEEQVISYAIGKYAESGMDKDAIVTQIMQEFSLTKEKAEEFCANVLRK